MKLKGKLIIEYKQQVSIDEVTLNTSEYHFIKDFTKHALNKFPNATKIKLLVAHQQFHWIKSNDQWYTEVDGHACYPADF